jgi:hypothetical protein
VSHHGWGLFMRALNHGLDRPVTSVTPHRPIPPGTAANKAHWGRRRQRCPVRRRSLPSAVQNLPQIVTSATWSEKLRSVRCLDPAHISAQI